MKEPLRVAGWAGIIAMVGGILFGLLSIIFQVSAMFVVMIFWTLIAGVLSILFLNGFLVLGKKYKNKLLVVMVWIGIGLAILSALAGLIGNIVSFAVPVNAEVGDVVGFDGGEFNLEEMSDEDLATAGMALFMVFLFVWLAISLPLAAYSILFGVGIYKLKDRIPQAKTTGILNIVAGATYPILIGIPVMIVAYFFEINLLFKASDKLEKRKA